MAKHNTVPCTTCTMYYSTHLCTQALHHVAPAFVSWLSLAWQHLHLLLFVSYSLLFKLFVAIVAAVATILTFKIEGSTAKTKTACKRSWHQSPARILRFVVVCLHVVPYWRRSLTCLGWLSDWKRWTVLRNQEVASFCLGSNVGEGEL